MLCLVFCFPLLGSVWIQLKTENWKLKTEKHCSKIIFKCVNSTVRLIFNEKVAEKWNLWVREQYTMCTDWLKKVRKIKLCGYCSLNSAWTVAASIKNMWKKKEKKRKNIDPDALEISPIQTYSYLIILEDKYEISPNQYMRIEGTTSLFGGKEK